MSDLSGRVALVTGAGRGIGRATALALAEHGAAVALVARGHDEIAQLAGEIKSAGGEALALEADVASEADVDSAVERVNAELGNLGILVTCAAAGPTSGPTEKLSLADWHAVIDVDLTGTFLACRAAGRAMLATGWGRIINLASFHVVATYPQRAAYVAAKAGVVGLTQALAVEWGGRGVVVNAIAPGPVRTDRTAWFMGTDPDAADGMIARTPTGRIADPEEVAALACYLASPAAGHVNGQTIVIDGGWTRNAWWGSHPWRGDSSGS